MSHSFYRLVELLPFVHIPRYWGIATKCLTYAKTSTDPFVYCLLRQQYRRVLVGIISRVMGKDRYSLSVYSTSSTLDTTDDNCVARITWASLCAQIFYWFDACGRGQRPGTPRRWRKESASCSRMLSWQRLVHRIPEAAALAVSSAGEGVKNAVWTLWDLRGLRCLPKGFSDFTGSVCLQRHCQGYATWSAQQYVYYCPRCNVCLQ